MNQDRKTIKFIADKGSARVGDVESYPIRIADRLIKRGLAEDYVVPRSKPSRASKSSTKQSEPLVEATNTE